MRTTIAVFTTAAVMGFGLVADAQHLTLRIQNGVVDLEADNVPLRQILDEWARIGGVAIVNADKTSAAPLTLRLANLPEKAALEVLLRGVSGYVLGARIDGAGPSAFGRILILPASTAAPETTARRTGRPTPAAFAASPLAASEPPASHDPSNGDVADAGAPAQTTQQLGGLQPIAPGGRPYRPGEPLPYRVEIDDAPAAEPPPAPVVATPANPFGSPAGSTEMGVITPVPPAAPPQRPRPRIVTQPSAPGSGTAASAPASESAATEP